MDPDEAEDKVSDSAANEAENDISNDRAFAVHELSCDPSGDSADDKCNNYSEHMLTKEEARKKAELQLKKHENNFFEDYEIKAKNTNIEVTDEGVKLKAVYTLYGEIAKESEFFIEK